MVSGVQRIGSVKRPGTYTRVRRTSGANPQKEYTTPSGDVYVSRRSNVSISPDGSRNYGGGITRENIENSEQESE